MFGKMGDMMSMLSKLKEAQKKMEEVKARLDQEFVTKSAENNTLEVTVSVAGNVKNIEIKDNSLPTTELQDILKDTLNAALAEAREKYEKEIATGAMEGMPGMGDLLKQ